MPNQKAKRHEDKEGSEYITKAPAYREYYVEVTRTDRRLFSLLELFRGILLVLVGGVGCLVWTRRAPLFPANPHGLSDLHNSDGVSILRSTSVADAVIIPADITKNKSSAKEKIQSPSTADDFEKRRAQCEAQFGKRRFLPKEEEQTPVILFSYPGSGNTWSRLLIDYATGVYSGSLYNDTKLYEALPGEAAGCIPNLSVFKVHPDTAPVEQVAKIGTCKSQQTIKEFKRVIVVTRHPIDALWSNYQREMQHGDHSKVLTRDMFDDEHFAKRQIKLVDMYLVSWERYDQMETTISAKDILYIRYEDLKNPEKRMASLRSMVDFLGIGKTDMEKLECAFLLSDRPDTHRQEGPQLSAQDKDKSSVSSGEKISKYDALAPYGCEIWSKVALYAETPRGGGHTLQDSLQGLHC